MGIRPEETYQCGTERTDTRTGYAVWEYETNSDDAEINLI